MSDIKVYKDTQGHWQAQQTAPSSTPYLLGKAVIALLLCLTLLHAVN